MYYITYFYILWYYIILYIYIHIFLLWLNWTFTLCKMLQHRCPLLLKMRTPSHTTWALPQRPGWSLEAPPEVVHRRNDRDVTWFQGCWQCQPTNISQQKERQSFSCLEDLAFFSSCCIFHHISGSWCHSFRCLPSSVKEKSTPLRWSATRGTAKL